MLRKRILERGRQDEIYPVLMTGPDSFMLDGQEYTGKPQTAGKRFSDGERAYVGFAGLARRQAIILAGSTRQDSAKNIPFSSVTFGEWLQSSQNFGLNAAGGQILTALLAPNGSDTNWDLPTDVDTGTLNVGLRALGLGRFKAPLRNWESGEPAEGDPVDVYVTCWPRNDGGDTGLCLGAWRVSDRVNLWIAQNGTSSDPWVNPDYPLPARFFVDKLNGWIHGLPSPTSSSPNTIFSAAAQDLYYTSGISRSSGGLNLANVSLYSFVVTVDETSIIESYLFCPAHGTTSGTGQSTVDFLKMNQDTGEWTSHSSFDVGDLPDGGDAAHPDTIPFGSETGTPVPWWQQTNQAIMFCSSGTQDVFDSHKWEGWNLTVRLLNPSDGTTGDILLSRSATASSSPTVLSNASLKTQIMAATHDLEYSTAFPWSAGYWLGGIQLGSDTNSAYAHFQDCVPILLPASGPNMARMGTVSSQLAADPDTGLRQWPANLENTGSGMVVERNSNDEDTLWLCCLVPEQCLLGGAYSHASGPDDLTGGEPTVQTYSFTFEEFNQCTGVNFSQPGFRQDTIVPYGRQPDVPPDEPYPPDFDACIDIGYPDMPDSHRTRTYATHDEGEHTQVINTWNQKLGCIWKTKIYAVLFDGTVKEFDITQNLDATHSMTIGVGAGAIGDAPPDTISATESDFPAPDNVWQLMAYGDRGLLLVLRDLHADGADKNPSPHLEIYNSGDESFGKLATVRLGSYSDLKASDDTSGDNLWLAGDQEWDPYAFGRPRMKGCKKINGDASALVLVMVGESKKVDVSSESQFKRVCYALIDLTNPTSPDVTRVDLTSPDEGVGSSGDVPTNWPLWWEWDSLILTPGHVAWIKDSKFREAITS